MTGRVRASLQRLTHNAGPIAVLGVFLLLAVVVYAVLRINAQQKTIVGLQRAQTESSKTGRGILDQVQHLVEQGNSFTDPNSAITKAQQAKVAGYLTSLASANQAALNDQTRRVGEMFEACHTLPCAVSTINRILAEPVPVPTFAGMTAVTPSPTIAASPAVAASSTPLSSPSRALSTPTPSPSPTLTPALLLQCPVICPQQH